MSDDEDKSYEDSLKEIANEANWSQKPDWFIEAIADLNLQAGIGYSLTFHTNGSLVSGELISGETYFHELGNQISKTGRASEGHENVIKVLSENMAKFSEIYTRRKELLNSDNSSGKARFIHLRETSVFFGNEEPINVGLWRGPLSEISGLSWGQLRASNV